MPNVTKTSEKAWLAGRRVQVGAAAAAIVAVALGLGARAVVRHVETDASYCATCHEAKPQFALWAQGEHHDVPCQRCHPQTLDQVLTTLVRFSTGPRDGLPVHSPAVSVAGCIACHEDEVGDWPQIADSVGHRVHLADVRVTCTSCHGREIHHFSDALSSCRECHPEKKLAISRMASLHCNACHDFLSSGDSLLPSRTACLDCHTSRKVPMPDVEGHADGPCDNCHVPHGGPGRHDPLLNEVVR